MSITLQPRIHYWLLVCSCYLLPLHTDSSPLTRSATLTYGREKFHPKNVDCAHESIAELIKTSPVILKALGARIFTNSDLKWFESLNGGDNFLMTPPPRATVPARKSTATQIDSDDDATMSSPMDDDDGDDSILITLTPETIYKGASLLKVTSTVANAARNSESMYQFEGQLNATLRPLSCFDGNVLKMLPTELIAFGKLVSVQQQQQQQEQQQQQREQIHPQQHGAEMLRISINGLHRWSTQFENHIWKHLGWDDWSDFTLCSVTCGKGVQQRFRRCLLDNPMMMMSLNMNMNLNDEEDDDDDDEPVDGNDNVNGDGNDNDDYNVDALDVERNFIIDDGYADEDEIILLDENQRGHQKVEEQHDVSYSGENDSNSNSNNNSSNINRIAVRNEKSKTKKFNAKDETNEKSNFKKVSTTTSMTAATAATTMSTADDDDNQRQRHHIRKQWSKYSMNFKDQTSVIFADDAVAEADVVADADNADIEVMRNFKGHLKVEGLSTTATAATTATATLARAESAGSASDSNESVAAGSNLKCSDKNKHKHGKRKKSAKSFSTMFCEGYNIEQRNCNTFECSDDLSDLLKFYKKFLIPDDVVPPILSSTMASPTSSNSKNLSSMPSLVTSSPMYLSADVANTPTTMAAGSSTMPSSTPANMGFIKSWRNNLNFTLMITLRVKNDTKTTATIFSIRNSTHNLYLEPSTEGLRLYLERDNQTEMLPVKFNLYDYRWHQVAISIQNGDFISIFVDCLWTNSFVVSKRLFSLPLDADVEIGRGFNGELQQLLVLPDNQERHQCSNVRTSINEVKRYIIDTFIDDYGN